VFNLSGSEIVVILLLALVVLGPEKLPEALRRAGRTYSELKKMGNSFQSEMRSVLDEPMKEMRDTADLLRKAVDVTVVAATTDTRAPQPEPADEPVPEVAAAEAELADAAPDEPTAAPAFDEVPDEPVPEVAAAEAELADATPEEPTADAPPFDEVADEPASDEPVVAAVADEPAPTPDPRYAVATNGSSMDDAPAEALDPRRAEDELINRTLSGGA
jgi:sec-independent protein translocase protein TatB